jgi:hypothetical protein
MNVVAEPILLGRREQFYEAIRLDDGLNRAVRRFHRVLRVHRRQSQIAADFYFLRAEDFVLGIANAGGEGIVGAALDNLWLGADELLEALFVGAAIFNCPFALRRNQPAGLMAASTLTTACSLLRSARS